MSEALTERQIIFTTRDIWNQTSWSDAVHFDFEGYDTSPFWDDDGTSYIVGSHAYKVEYVRAPTIQSNTITLSGQEIGLLRSILRLDNYTATGPTCGAVQVVSYVKSVVHRSTC